MCRARCDLNVKKFSAPWPLTRFDGPSGVYACSPFCPHGNAHGINHRTKTRTLSPESRSEIIARKSTNVISMILTTQT